MPPLHHPRNMPVIRRQHGSGDKALQPSSLIDRLCHARGHTREACERRSLADLPDPWQLAGMRPLVKHLASALQSAQSILVLGDFDADGATSSALAVLGLRAMGAKNVDYLVPNRFDYGYGMSEAIVAEAALRKPDWIMTVDNGISSHAGTQYARNLGIGVLITDHHLPGETLPEADAIVNPCLNDDDFPARSLAGVGVMFFVLVALRQHLREQGWFSGERPEPGLADFLDLVALGTVADVVTLDPVNRILVHQGMQRIRRAGPRPGIAALLSIAGRDYRHIDAQDLAFTLAPRLNAAGRMQDMSTGIECLLSDDPHRAGLLAEQLNQMNLERRQRESEMQGEALQLLRTDDGGLDSDAAGLCLYQPGWHQGIVGILAARIKDRYDRPVIVFADSDSDTLKGSARSIPSVHIRDTLSDISTRYPDLMTGFGGHAMAAGVTLPRQHLAMFQQAFAEAVRQRRTLPATTGILSDGELDESAFSQITARQIQEAGPWGQGFPLPVFDGTFEVINNRIVGGRHLKMTLAPEGSRRQIDAIAFQVDAPERWIGQSRIRAAYRLEINQYQGKERLQMAIEYMETC